MQWEPAGERAGEEEASIKPLSKERSWEKGLEMTRLRLLGFPGLCFRVLCFMPGPLSGWVCLGESWGACWGLQGAISLAGEVGALGLVLKHAEVAGAAGH